MSSIFHFEAKQIFPRQKLSVKFSYPITRSDFRAETYRLSDSILCVNYLKRAKDISRFSVSSICLPQETQYTWSRPKMFGTSKKFASSRYGLHPGLSKTVAESQSTMPPKSPTIWLAFARLFSKPTYFNNL